MCRYIGKYLLVILYSIVVLIGLLIIGAGIYVIFEIRSLATVTQNLPEGIDSYVQLLHIVPSLIIAVGVVVSLIALAGCCGVATETKCLLLTYTVFIAILAFAKIVATILVFVLLPYLIDFIKRTLADYSDPKNFGKNMLFNVLESKLACHKTECTTLIVNTVQTCGRAIEFGLISVISVEVFAIAVSIYLIKTRKPKSAKEFDHQLKQISKI